MPVDFGPTGNSETLGGPIDRETNRMLVRSRILLTDMHDGRKKTYLPLNGNSNSLGTSDKLILKLAVGLRSGSFTE